MAAVDKIVSADLLVDKIDQMFMISVSGTSINTDLRLVDPSELFPEYEPKKYLMLMDRDHPVLILFNPLETVVTNKKTLEEAMNEC